MENPFKTVSKIENGQVNYNFKACLRWLDATGKKQFGPHFAIREDDHAILYKLLTYAVGDQENMAKHHLHPRKGILLSGPVGCGKTTVLTLINYFFPEDKRYTVVPAREVALRFVKDGYPVIHTYSMESFNHNRSPFSPRIYCFDDLGSEPSSIQYFGNECNVMAEILLSRYDRFVKRQMLTHLTTNLSATDLELRYGQRVRSRMREMFNLISFDKNTQDKRI
jgi:energy-coupling factor transporter ATP-binding protein EcfA2